MIHSDQGSQFSSSDWQSFLKANNLISSMSRRGTGKRIRDIPIKPADLQA